VKGYTVIGAVLFAMGCGSDPWPSAHDQALALASDRALVVGKLGAASERLRHTQRVLETLQTERIGDHGCPQDLMTSGGACKPTPTHDHRRLFPARFPTGK